VVQTVGSDQILVQLPGVNDPQQAERVLGGTAQLDFRKQKPGTESQLLIEQQVRQEYLQKQAQLRHTGDENAIAENQKAALERSNEAIAKLFERTKVTGKNLKDAVPNPLNRVTAGKFLSALTPAGGEGFAQLTKDLAGTGRSIGIFLDNALISAPYSRARICTNGITGGGAVITGNYTAQTANELAVQLRGGALPVPVEIVENRTVGATLGRDSIQRSIYAGIGGLTLVLMFHGRLLPPTRFDC
jgi:preprotein translocase subunit SecD